MNYPINSNNIIGWLKLIHEVYPLNDEDREALEKFIKRTDVVRRKKELEQIFGEMEDG